MTLDEEIVQNKLINEISHITVDKISSMRDMTENKNKLVAIIGQSDIQMLLDHDDCPKSNITSLTRMALKEINSNNTNWRVVQQLIDEIGIMK